MITLGQGYAVGSQRNTNILTFDPPANTVADLLLLLVGTADITGSATTFTATGWNSIEDQAESASGVQTRARAYWKAGVVADPITVSADQVLDDFKAVVLVLSGAALTSPVTGSNGNVGVGTAFSVGPITTDPNSMVIALWVGTQGFANPTTITTDMLLAGEANSSYASVALGVSVFLNSGSTGIRSNSFTGISGLYANIIFGIKQYPGPTISTVVYPNGGQSLVVGASVTLDCTAAASPTVAQSALQYEYSYSTNNGGTWTTIGLSSAGVTSKAWTVPNVVGSGNLIRVRAFDGTLYSADYDTSDTTFAIIAETTPGPPVISLPAAGVAYNKAVVVPIAWAHQGGSGNPQTQFTLQWATDIAFTSPTTVGPTSTAVQGTSIDFSALAVGTTVYLKVKTRGVSLESAYSAARAFIVAALPAAPNITAPLAGSPPSNPQPTITFTAADAFVARRMRVVIGGVEAYNSEEVAGSVLSFVESPYSFANGIAVTLYLSVKNSYGLWSTEDSETFTPAYTGPATPTALYSLGLLHILTRITNSDSVSYNEVWRRISGQAKALALRVGRLILEDGSFADYNVKSGVQYVYFPRAYNSAGLFTDGADSSAQVLTLDNLAVHAVHRSNASSNALGNPVSLLSLADSATHGYNEAAGVFQMIGRSAPVIVYGQAVWERMAVSVAIPFAQESTLTDLFIIWRAQSGNVCCARDNLGNRIFGRMSRPKVVDDHELHIVTFEVEQTRYSEGL